MEMKTNYCILASAGKRSHDLTLEHPVGQNVYALSQQYGDDIWYRAKVLRSRQVRGDRAYFVHFYGYPSCEDEWIDELDTIPVYKIDKGGRVYAYRTEDDDAQDCWFPGTIQGYRKNETDRTKNLKGSRQYHVKFDDGGEDKRINELFVMPYNVFISLDKSDEVYVGKKSNKSNEIVEACSTEFSAHVQESDSKDLLIGNDTSSRSGITIQGNEALLQGYESINKKTELECFKKKDMSNAGKNTMSLRIPTMKRKFSSFPECNVVPSKGSLYMLDEKSCSYPDENSTLTLTTTHSYINSHGSNATCTQKELINCSMRVPDELNKNLKGREKASNATGLTKLCRVSSNGVKKRNKVNVSNQVNPDYSSNLTYPASSDMTCQICYHKVNNQNSAADDNGLESIIDNMSNSLLTPSSPLVSKEGNDSVWKRASLRRDSKNQNPAKVKLSSCRNMKKRKLCNFPECIKFPQKAGFCAAHGKRCEYPECINLVANHGLCITHVVLANKCSHPKCDKFSLGESCGRVHVSKRKKCSHPDCTLQAYKGGLCTRHCNSVKRSCSHPDCNNHPIQNGVCYRHGAVRKRCSFPECTNIVKKDGVCIKHGALRDKKMCTQSGCQSRSFCAGLCRKHGRGKGSKCLFPDCNYQQYRLGVCIFHGGKKSCCVYPECKNQATKGGLCVRHGATKKKCSFSGCVNNARRGGVCHKHGAKGTLKKRRSQSDNGYVPYRVQKREDVIALVTEKVCH